MTRLCPGAHIFTQPFTDVRSVHAEGGRMNMVHFHLPRETETGCAGEQPVKGYRGQAHQTMRWRGVQLASRPPLNTSSNDRPAMPQKRKILHANLCPGNRARHSFTFPERGDEYPLGESGIDVECCFLRGTGLRNGCLGARII